MNRIECRIFATGTELRLKEENDIRNWGIAAFYFHVYETLFYSKSKKQKGCYIFGETLTEFQDNQQRRLETLKAE